MEPTGQRADARARDAGLADARRRQDRDRRYVACEPPPPLQRELEPGAARTNIFTGVDMKLASICSAVLATALLTVSAAGGQQPAPVSRAAASAADSADAHRAALGFLAAFDSLQWEPFPAYLADDVTMFFPSRTPRGAPTDATRWKRASAGSSMRAWPPGPVRAARDRRGWGSPRATSASR